MAQNWEVTNQEQEDVLNDAGAFIPHVRVYFQTIPEGIRGNLLIRKNLYSPDYVRDLVDAEVTTLKAVHNL